MTTESKELREETDRNQRLMASIFEAIQDGICILDPDMRIVQTNPRMENMYGNGQPMADQACYKVFHNRETPCDPCPARETFLEGKNKTFTQAARFRSGASGWVEVNAFPICDEAGRVVQVIESVRNVTERKKAEDLLRKNQDFLNGILQSLPDKIAVRDTDLRIIHCNWEEQAPETLLDQAMRVQTAVCGDGPCDQCVVQQAFITHETMQVRKEDPVSGRIWEISAYPVVDQNDEATMLIEYFHDITDKKEASEELVRIRAALDDATDGIIVLSREGKVTYMNLAFAEAFRCTADSLNEKGIQTIFTDQSIAKQLFAATFNYDSWTHEVMMEAGDGRQFPALLRATPILNDNIEAIGALLVINDISERKQMERQILQSQKLE
ncbi:MAG: PAS domain-containing protein, partial [Candidatus Sumerlaeota bacterium]